MWVFLKYVLLCRRLLFFAWVCLRQIKRERSIIAALCQLSHICNTLNIHDDCTRIVLRPVTKKSTHIKIGSSLIKKWPLWHSRPGCFMEVHLITEVFLYCKITHLINWHSWLKFLAFLYMYNVLPLITKQNKNIIIIISLLFLRLCWPRYHKVFL